MHRIFIAGWLALLLVGCDKLEYVAPVDQPVFFEYHYVNHAWGFQEQDPGADH